MNTEAMEVHAALGEGWEPTDLFTERGTHDGCGQCCSRFLPLTIGEAVMLRNRARDVDVRPQRGEFDLECPFLGADNRCMVYDSRPSICRSYDCSKHAKLGAAAALDLYKLVGGRHIEMYDVRELVQ